MLPREVRIPVPISNSALRISIRTKLGLSLAVALAPILAVAWVTSRELSGIGVAISRIAQDYEPIRTAAHEMVSRLHFAESEVLGYLDDRNAERLKNMAEGIAEFKRSQGRFATLADGDATRRLAERAETGRARFEALAGRLIRVGDEQWQTAMSLTVHRDAIHAVLDAYFAIAVHRPAAFGDVAPSVIADMKASVRETANRFDVSCLQEPIDCETAVAEVERTVERSHDHGQALPLSAAERQVVEEMRALWNDGTSQVRRIVDLKAQERDLRAELTASREAIGEVLHGVLRLCSRSGMRNSKEEALQATARAKSLTFITLTGTLGIALVAARLLGKNLTARIESIETAMHAEVDGKLEKLTEPRFADELSDLAGTFQRTAMARFEAEHALRRSHDDMDERVRKRTLELTEVNKRLTFQIANREGAEKRLQYAASHDSLTGLPNRAMLTDRLRQCILRADRQAGYLCAVLFIDLDNFKLINDSFGHDAGDELLVQTGGRLLTALRGNDSVARLAVDMAARLGGDEFVILLDALRSSQDVLRVAERIQQDLTQPFHLRGHEITLSGSIGVTLIQPGSRAEDVLREADTAMYRAKLAGKAQHAVFDVGMYAAAKERLKLENELRRAMEQQQFELFYQPIVNLSSAGVAAFEALLRWRHPERGLVNPADFIPIAEETGLITEIGRWVLEQSLRQLAAWHQRTGVDPELGITINVSRRQLFDRSLASQLRQLLTEFSIPPHLVRLEITESVIVIDPQMTRQAINRLKKAGVQLYLDDFGTGLSSLSCLMDFPIDALKIDRSFVEGLKQGRTVTAIVHAVTSLARNLGIAVVAEGIADEAQLAQVLTLDCDFGQGFLFSPPVPAKEAEALLLAKFTLEVVA